MSSESDCSESEEKVPVLFTFLDHTRKALVSKGCGLKEVTCKVIETFKDVLADNQADLMIIKYFDDEWKEFIDLQDEPTIYSKTRLQIDLKQDNKKRLSKALLVDNKKNFDLSTKATGNPQQSDSDDGESGPKPLLASMLQRIRGKFKAEPTASASSTKKISPSVKIQVGWLHMNNKLKDYTQVRCQKGGGVRYLTCDRKATYVQLLEGCVPLFFPAGESSKGPRSKMEFSLANFQGHEIEKEDFDLSTVYGEKGSKTRIYIKTKEIQKDNSSSSSSSLEEVPFDLEHQDSSFFDLDTPTVSFKRKRMVVNDGQQPSCSFTNSGPTPSPPSSMDQHKKDCRICYDRNQDSFLIPCGHKLCAVCAVAIEEQKQGCPFCKETILKIGELFG
ncbi:uncharacterized protein [Asterias amurensis]|uniref:uncharacterized protein n=1 Tax=Asterias amurensis TaxID=7602 RepID=UPI003AB1213A